jgi:YgiT-type zinc finger domain-containing protein
MTQRTLSLPMSLPGSAGKRDIQRAREKKMTEKRCPMCKGDMAPGTTDLTLRRGRSVVVVQAVPALVCQDCKEVSIDAEVASAVHELALREMKRGVALEFCTFAA